MTHALELHAVVKNYGRRQALAGLDLEIPGGSIFGLVGSNGAGKTTAMALTLGLLRASSGRINLLGEGPFDPEKHTGRVSLLPQDSRLPLHSHVDELLLYYGRLQGLKKEPLAASVDHVLEWVNLQDRRHSPVKTLSHGMMRRLTIAQAFLGEPELVLLDEPMNGLDPREAARIRNLLLQRRGKQTIVISSHNLHELESLCDRAAFIEQGKLLRQDTMDNLMRRSQSVSYTLVPGTIPMEAIHKALADTTVELSADGCTLTIKYQGRPNGVATLNAQVLQLLLNHGVGVVEIQRGSNLESAYLAATSRPPALPQ